MSYDPENFAKQIFPRFPLRERVCVALLKRPNWGFTAEDLNEKLDRENSETAIEGIRGVLRELGTQKQGQGLLELGKSENPRGPPTKVYKPGSLMETYQMPIFFHVLGKERRSYVDYQADIILAPSEENTRVDGLLEFVKNDGTHRQALQRVLGDIDENEEPK